MSSFEAFILGLIQGLTEFLPVSSSGHLEIGNVLLGVQESDNLLFAVILHAATALSTIVVLRKEIAALIIGLFKFQWNESWVFATQIVISMVPVGVVGVLFEDEISSFFSGNLLLVGGALLFTSLLLFFTHFKKDNHGAMGFITAFIVGLAQAIAIIPGVSRSGTTIATALILGIEKTKATQFSFMMVLVPIFGASLLKMKDYLEAGAAVPISNTALIVGFVSAFVTGYMACRWMLAIVRRGKLSYFAIYCAVVGSIAILSQVV